MLFSIRRAQPEDAPILTEIAHLAKRSWGYPDHWIQLWQYSLTIEPDYIRNNPVYLAYQGDEILGFYALSTSNEIIELDHLWIRPEVMRQGIGRALFVDALSRTAEAGKTRLSIQADPHAEGFYVQMGAHRVGCYEYDLDGQTRQLPILEIEVPESPVNLSRNRSTRPGMGKTL